MFAIKRPGARQTQPMKAIESSSDRSVTFLSANRLLGSPSKERGRPICRLSALGSRPARRDDGKPKLRANVDLSSSVLSLCVSDSLPFPTLAERKEAQSSCPIMSLDGTIVRPWRSRVVYERRWTRNTRVDQSFLVRSSLGTSLADCATFSVLHPIPS